MQAVIMAAGASTRTEPLTLTRPKPLLPVANEPLLAHQIRGLMGIADEVVVVVGYKREMIRDHFGDSFEGMPLRYVLQDDPQGTGHAVLLCRDAIDGPFLAMNGDDLYAPGDLKALSEVAQGALAKEIEDPSRLGIFDVTDGNRVTRIVEKPTEIFSHLANVGAYKFPVEVFDILANTAPSERGEIEITSAVQALSDAGDFRAVVMDDYWLSVGYAWHLLDVNAYFLEHFMVSEIRGEVSPGAHVTGPLFVDEGAVVKPGAVIEGPVYVGKNATVGPNCYIRPATTIGDGCKVGNACEVKNCVMMKNSAVPHLSYVGDTVIGEGSNLGAGTITANFRHDGKNIPTVVKGQMIDSGRRKFGAIIADDVHTGIHTSIYPGRKLWPHTATYPGEVVTKDITKEKRRPPR